MMGKTTEFMCFDGFSSFLSDDYSWGALIGGELIFIWKKVLKEGVKNLDGAILRHTYL